MLVCDLNIIRVFSDTETMVLTENRIKKCKCGTCVAKIFQHINVTLDVLLNSILLPAIYALDVHADIAFTL